MDIQNIISRDITANASEAFGGRVIVDAQGIFGTEFRNRLIPESDITATSDLGVEFSGTVEINTLDVDPSDGLFALPTELVDASGLIVSAVQLMEGMNSSSPDAADCHPIPGKFLEVTPCR